MFLKFEKVVLVKLQLSKSFCVGCGHVGVSSLCVKCSLSVISDSVTCLSVYEPPHWPQDIWDRLRYPRVQNEQ